MNIRQIHEVTKGCAPISTSHLESVILCCQVPVHLCHRLPPYEATIVATKPHPHVTEFASRHLKIVMRRLMTGIRSEKCDDRRFRLCANVIEITYTNLDSTLSITQQLMQYYSIY